MLYYKLLEFDKKKVVTNYYKMTLPLQENKHCKMCICDHPVKSTNPKWRLPNCLRQLNK